MALGIQLVPDPRVDAILQGQLVGPEAASVLREAHRDLRELQNHMLQEAKRLSQAEDFLVYGSKGRGQPGFIYA